MKEYTKGEYEFYIKAIADGGEFYTTQLMKFRSQCGKESTVIEPQNEIQGLLVYEIDG